MGDASPTSSPPSSGVGTSRLPPVYPGGVQKLCSVSQIFAGGSCTALCLTDNRDYFLNIFRVSSNLDVKDTGNNVALVSL